MKKIKKWSISMTLIVALTGYIGVLSWIGDAKAQQQVLMNGQDPVGNNHIVQVDTGGRLTAQSTHASCSCQQMTIGTTSQNTPNTPMSNRTTLSIQLVTTSQTLTCRDDGQTVTSLGAGMVIGYLDLLNDNLNGSSNMTCICSAAGCSVNVCECP